MMSEPRMASAGVEPWMGSSTDKHLPRSTTCATHSVILNRVASQMRARSTSLMLLFPRWVILPQLGRYAILGSLVADPVQLALSKGVVSLLYRCFCCLLGARAARPHQLAVKIGVVCHTRYSLNLCGVCNCGPAVRAPRRTKC